MTKGDEGGWKLAQLSSRVNFDNAERRWLYLEWREIRIFEGFEEEITRYWRIMEIERKNFEFNERNIYCSSIN